MALLLAVMMCASMLPVGVFAAETGPGTDMTGLPGGDFSTDDVYWEGGTEGISTEDTGAGDVGSGSVGSGVSSDGGRRFLVGVSEVKAALSAVTGVSPLATGTTATFTELYNSIANRKSLSGKITYSSETINGATYGKFTLLCDVEYDSSTDSSHKRIEMVAGRKAIIDLNGHRIDALGKTSNSVISVTANSTLILRDSSAAKTGIITGGTGYSNTTSKKREGGGVHVWNNANFTLEGGTITGNTAGWGGGVAVHCASASVGTFTMTGGTITGNTASNGGGVYVSINGTKIGTFTMSGGTISGNTATESGGGVNNLGTFTMSGGTISGNDVTGGGGGIYNTGTFTMSGGTISGNDVTGSGGGVYNRSSFTVGNGTITGNEAGGSGGGIYNYSGTLKMNGGTVKGNKAVNGGGVYNRSGYTFTMGGGNVAGNTADTYGGGVYNEGTFGMSAGTLEGNSAATLGQEIYSKANSTLNGGTIEGKYTNEQTFERYRVAGDGKVAANIGLALVSIKSVSFKDSSIVIQGIGTCSQEPVIVPSAVLPSGIDGAVKTWTSSNIGVATVDADGLVTSVGPGTATIRCQVCDTIGSYSVTVSLKGVTRVSFGTASASVSVGHTYAQEPVVEPADATVVSRSWTSSDPGVATVDADGTVTGVAPGTAVITCTVNDGAGSKSASYSIRVFHQPIMAVVFRTPVAAMYMTGDMTYVQYPVTEPADATVAAMTWTSSDPGVATVDADGTVTRVAEGTAVIACTVSDGKNSAAGSYEVRVFDAVGTFKELNAAIKDGTSSSRIESSDGAVKLFCDVSYGGTSDDDTITIASGQTILIDLNGHSINGMNKNGTSVITVALNGELTLADSSLDGTGTVTGGTGHVWDSYRCGGGVYNLGKFVMTGGTITGNTATYGGGVFSDDLGVIEMSGGRIAENMCEQDGGGVCSRGIMFMMTGGMITGNTARVGGGVAARSTHIYSSGVEYNGVRYYHNGTFIMTAGEISGNTADLYGGGVDSAHEFEMRGGEITGNATMSSNGVYGGGGVHYNDTFMMSGGKIIGNKSASHGGGATGNKLIMTGGTISENMCELEGGGVFCLGTSKMSGGEISGNSAGNTGGGVYNNDSFTMYDGTISGNKATRCGGGVMNKQTTGYSTSFTMNGGRITDNSVYAGLTNGTHSGGGGVYSNGLFTVTGGTISGNKANTYGGGVYNRIDSYSIGRFVMTGGSVHDNDAGILGKAICAEKGSRLEGIIDGMFVNEETGTRYRLTSTGKVDADVGLSDSCYPIKACKFVTTGTSIFVGGTYMQDPIIAPASAPGTRKVWASSDECVAMVDADGNVTGVAPGTATITCTVGNASDSKTASYDIKVSCKPLTGVMFGTASVSVPVHGTYAQDPVAVPDGAIVTGMAWSSSDTGVAVVDADGNVTGVAPGTATITCVADDGEESFTASYEISVAGNQGSFAELNAAIAGGTSSGKFACTDNTVKLLCDVVYGGTGDSTCISMSSGVTSITIDLNGHSIDARGESNKSVIIISSGKTLTLMDSSIDGSGIVTGGTGVFDMDGGGVHNSGTFIMNGGTITGNISHFSCGGVYIYDKCKFTMNGGTIRDNIGCGVYSSSFVGAISTFTMNGGTISNNSGFGVCNIGGTFTMCNGCMISGNGLSGVYNENQSRDNDNGTETTIYGNFIMRGGTISGNGDGGVRNIRSAVTIYDGTIVNNKATTGGGIDNFGGTVTMYGGEITDNVVTGRGGGVYNCYDLYSATAFTMSGGIIAGNTAEAFGGGVYNEYNDKYTCTFRMTGGTLKDNVAGILGQAIYACQDGILGGSAIDGKFFNEKTFELYNLPSGGKVVANIGLSGPYYRIEAFGFESDATISVGETYTQAPVMVPVEGTVVGKAWTSSDDSVATVDDTGTVTGVAAGTATITCTVDNLGSGMTASYNVTVTYQPLVGVRFASDASVPIGDTYTQNPIVEPGDASLVGRTWVSSDESIAVVDHDGEVTGVGVGTATITYMADDGNNSYTASYEIEVVPRGAAPSEDGGDGGFALPKTGGIGTEPFTAIGSMAMLAGLILIRRRKRR